jgi:hypothetical protein
MEVHLVVHIGHILNKDHFVTEVVSHYSSQDISG